VLLELGPRSAVRGGAQALGDVAHDGQRELLQRRALRDDPLALITTTTTTGTNQLATCEMISLS